MNELLRLQPALGDQRARRLFHGLRVEGAQRGQAVLQCREMPPDPIRPEDRSRGLAMVKSWHAFKKKNAGKWTDAQCTKRVADDFGVDDSTVRRALKKHRAET